MTTFLENVKNIVITWRYTCCHKCLFSVVYRGMKTSILFFLCLTIELLACQVRADSSIDLSSFLNEVRSKNLGLIAEKYAVESSEARASGVRLNPPMIGLMQMKDQTGNNNGFELSQEIQFPTKISRDKRIRDLELSTQRELSGYQKNIILVEARNAFVVYWAALNRFNILKEKLQWLHHHSKISSALSWTDTSAKIHQLEIESEVDLVANEVTSLDAEVLEKRNNLQVFAPGFNIENKTISEPPIEKISGTLLGANTNKKSRQIVLKQKELETKEAIIDLKRRSYLPDFVVRYRSYNGGDTFSKSQELMLGMTVPFIFPWQTHSEVAEASAQKLKTEADLQKIKIEVESRISSLVKKAESIESQMKNLIEKLIPRAEKKIKLVRNLSQRTMEGLDQHKMVMLSFLDLKIKLIELKLEQENTVREYLKLTGFELEEGGK